MRRSSPFAPLALALVLLLGTRLAGAAPASPTAEELAGHVAALTAPEMEGRGSATEGGERAARYLEASLAALGLRPGGDGGTWRQSFVVRRGVRVGPGSALARTGASPLDLAVGQDWMPHGGSQSGEVEAEIVFAGRGEDYAGVDARGKIALVLGGGVTRLEKLIAALQAGAAAVLIVAAGLPSLEATTSHVALPSATLTPAAVDVLLAPIGRSHAALVQSLVASPGAAAFPTGVRARLAVRLEAADRRADNIIGILPGTDPALAGEAVVIGAHYDHLGRIGGAVYPGADDNASGTAVVLGLARAFAAAGGAPRTLVFILFSGEELGLLGAGHYVRHPVVPLERTTAMVNFDMVGRMRDGRLSVSGVESGAGLRAVVTAAAAGAGLQPVLRDSPYGPSDHARFYSAGVPIVFFNTGRHPDYHKPTDTADRLDVAGMTQIAAMAVRLVESLATAPRPVYARVAPSAGRPQPEGTGAQPAGGAFLGVSLDGQSAADGLRLGAILPGTGAERAGLREGDVLVRLGETGINGFEDLRSALARQSPGDTVRVVYLRDGQDHAASVTLGTRP
jgi:aminopeptidase YwaD